MLAASGAFNKRIMKNYELFNQVLVSERERLYKFSIELQTLLTYERGTNAHALKT